MSHGKLEQIRAQEKIYHDSLYNSHELFEKGSWLFRPMEEVLHAFAWLDHDGRDKNILDLGCGVGRHSIPLAQMLSGEGKIVCVDMLDSAIDNLLKYSKGHSVEDRIELVRSDVETYSIEKDVYDGIVSVSCIEHVSNEKAFRSVLERMREGTRARGVNCIVMNTDIVWKDVSMGKDVNPLVELNFSQDQALQILRDVYEEWNEQRVFMKKWGAHEIYNKRDIYFESNCLCFVVEKV